MVINQKQLDDLLKYNQLWEKRYEIDDDIACPIDLSERIFEDCVFTDNDLTEANMANSEFRNCRFDGVVLNITIFTDAKFKNCQFHRVQMEETDLERASIENSVFLSSEFHFVNFMHNHLTNVVFKDVCIGHTHLSDSHLTDVTIEDSELYDSDFSNVIRKNLTFNLKSNQNNKNLWTKKGLTLYVLNIPPCIWLRLNHLRKWRPNSNRWIRRMVLRFLR